MSEVGRLHQCRYKFQLQPDTAFVSLDGTLILWKLNLDDLMARGCDWLHDYLTTNPNVSDSDRRLCDGIGHVRKVSAVPKPQGDEQPQWFAWLSREWRAWIGG